jgi:hypothetical protein
MNQDNHIIMGVHITDRVKKTPRIQELFAEFGCHIRTRLGLHEASDKFCSPNGLIILEMLDEPKVVEELRAKLREIDGVETQTMVFRHQ